MNFQLFNRHELFTNEDINLVFDFQDFVMGKDAFVYNAVCGLFDGYLYDSILPFAAEFPKMNELVKRIQDSI
jgi:hypothetical protein